MKKIISLIMASLLVAVVLCSCTGDSSGDNTSAESTQSGDVLAGDGTKSPSGYDKSFDGFVKYMTDNGFVDGDGEELTANIIGASQGKRFTVQTPVSKHTVELYEFTDTTTKEAQRVISDARKDGSFHLFESTETVTAHTTAAVNADGTFLMLYTDTSDKDNTDEQIKKAVEAVQAFYSKRH